MSKMAAMWSGWILFAGVMMLLIGAFNILQGFAAIGSDDYFVRTEDQLLVLDFTLWGWLILAWGALLVTVGSALVTGKEWARWPAVVVVGINVIGHAAFMAFPIWNVLVIAMSVAVIFALTVRWQEAQADMSGPAR